MEEKIKWCIDQHRNTNHYYDAYLPYEFHLRMVVQVADDFKNLLPQHSRYGGIPFIDTIKLACWGHDLIEDTRTSYNDVVSVFKNDIANAIVYACTNEKGRNRKERANDKYYEGIKKTAYATFVKLCDRIANVQYSKLTKSRMFEMYKKENKVFSVILYDEKLKPMFNYLEQLLNQ